MAEGRKVTAHEGDRFEAERQQILDKHTRCMKSALIEGRKAVMQPWGEKVEFISAQVESVTGKTDKAPNLSFKKKEKIKDMKKAERDIYCTSSFRTLKT